MRAGGEQLRVRLCHPRFRHGGNDQVIRGPVTRLLLGCLHERARGPLDTENLHVRQAGGTQLSHELFGAVEVGQGEPSCTVIDGRLKDLGDGVMNPYSRPRSCTTSRLLSGSHRSRASPTIAEHTTDALQRANHRIDAALREWIEPE